MSEFQWLRQGLEEKSTSSLEKRKCAPSQDSVSRLFWLPFRASVALIGGVSTSRTTGGLHMMAVSSHRRRNVIHITVPAHDEAGTCGQRVDFK